MQLDKLIKNIEIQKVDFEIASKPDLQHLIETSISLRMVVAFWTIKPDAISHNLSNLLSKPGSFSCVDIHQPTNIDHICDLAQKKSNMFFHGKRINEKKKPDGKTPKLPTNLLHSKILLFDVTDNEAELWIGSHNWTEYALGGFNIETSLKVKLYKNSKLYIDAENLLNSILSQCSPVYPHLRETYKSIQESETKVAAVTLKISGNELPENAIVHIFGTNLKDYKALSTVGSKIYTTVLTRAGKELLFEADILKTGYLPKAKPEVGWTNLEEAFWTLYTGTTPTLQQKSSPNESFLIDKALFWVTLVLDKKCPDHLWLDPPSEPIPYIPIQSETTLRMWKEKHGWVHPDRGKAPTITEIQFEKLKNLHPANVERIEFLYGDPQTNATTNDMQNNHSNSAEDCNIPLSVGYEPLLRKLVLKGGE